MCFIVKDRRFLVGSLFKNENVYFLNGLGMCGLLMVLFFLKYLFDFMENGIDLFLEIDIKWFFK